MTFQRAHRAQTGSAPRIIMPTPFQLRDPASIPAREWLYDRHLIRRYVSLTVAPGAAGKTSLLVTDAIALATGRDLLGCPVYGGPKRVWLWNLEDPADELERRIAAACIHHGVAPHDLGDRLFVDSGRDMGLCIAEKTLDGVTINRPDVDGLIAALADREIDVLLVDPFVSSHAVPENDNGAIDAVVKTWGRVADEADCAIGLSHHLRKLGADQEATAEHSRGGVALVAAARSCRVLNRMTKDEAARAGVENPRSYFRVHDDKNNLAPPSDQSTWFRLQSVALPNGDHVAAVECWQWPNPMDDVTADDLLAVQKALHGKNYRESIQAKDWAGNAVADVLGLDMSETAAKARVKGLLRTWISSGALVITQERDSKGTMRPVIAVGTWANQ